MKRLIAILRRMIAAVTKADRKAARKVRQAELEARKATDAILSGEEENDE